MAARTLPDWAGLREYRKARETGLMVGLYDGEEAGMDVEGGRWQTVCERHAWIVSHETLALAREWLSNPTGFCDVCGEFAAAAAEGREPEPWAVQAHEDSAETA